MNQLPRHTRLEVSITASGRLNSLTTLSALVSKFVASASNMVRRFFCQDFLLS